MTVGSTGPASPAKATGTVRIATRASALALWQARRVAWSLEELGIRTELVEVVTKGDSDRRPFSELSGTGLFTKAVQEAVLAGEADIAVHSFKDLPSATTAGLVLAAMPERADARDVLLTSSAAYTSERPGAGGDEHGFLPLHRGARVGTSAVRRRAQLLSLRPDLETLELRGNVPTRVEKLRSGEFDAVLLAKAGLDRLGLDLGAADARPELHVTVLEPHVMMPAPAQGALAIECREDDLELAATLARLDDKAARRFVTAERALLARFDAGCQLALGAYASAHPLEPVGVSLAAWFAGRHAVIVHADPLEAARLAYEALVHA